MSEKKPLFDTADPGVTRDLSQKIVLDVFDLINRTTDIAPPPHAAIVVAAAAAAVGMLAATMQKQTGVPLGESGKPGVPAIVLAALAVARFCINTENDYLGEAMQDTAILIKARF